LPDDFVVDIPLGDDDDFDTIDLSGMNEEEVRDLLSDYVPSDEIDLYIADIIDLALEG